MKKKLLHISMVSILMCNMFFADGQIYSNTADAVKPITYKTYVGDDQLFVFYQSHGTLKEGTLSADAPEEGPFEFQWTKYDPDADGFTINVSNESGVTSSTIRNLGEGGYRVHITDGADTDTTWTAWVMLDELKVWNLKDDEGNIPSYQSNCVEINLLFLSGFVEVDTFYYFDPVSHDTLWYENDFTIEWTSDEPGLFIPNSTNPDAMELNRFENPPIEDTWFILSATDSMGMTEIDSVFFNSPFTKAEFTVEYWDKVNDSWSADLTSGWSKDDGSLDAPLEVSFINESVNGFKYEWVLLDSTEQMLENQGAQTDPDISPEETIVRYSTTDKEERPNITYYTADEFYYPYLISLGDTNNTNTPCRDTFKLEDGIEVVESQLSIPNVFTPNDDGTNDVFTFKHQSIKSFKITISDRAGRIVYRDQIEDIYQWEGWNGTVNNNGREVPEGQYYYVIEGVGYDNEIYKDDNWIKRWNDERQRDGGGLLPGGTSSQNPTGNGDDQEESLNRYIGWVYLFRHIGEF